MKVLGQRDLFPVRGSSKDERIAAIAALQRGRVRRSQLLAAGVSNSAIETRLKRGLLHHRHAGVYAVGHSGPAEFTRETEALLACPDGACLSHLSAAAIWGLLPAQRGDAPVEITIRGTQAPRRRGVRAHRTKLLEPKDVRIQHRLPVTSPARTHVDIAGLVTEQQLERALDDSLNRKLVRVAQLREALTRAGPGRKGVQILDALLADREHGSGITRSDAERELRDLIRLAHLPEPELNVQLEHYEVDLMWRDQRLIVEIDSFEHHLRRASFERDRRRDADLEAQGWTVIRFTASRIKREPYAVIAQLAQALVWAQATETVRRGG